MSGRPGLSMFDSSDNLARMRRSPAQCAFRAAAFLWFAGFAAAPTRLIGAENAPPHASVDRSGDLRVTSGMTLHVNADLGNVRIETLPPNAPSVLHYAVHVETDVPGTIGQKLLDFYSLTTRETVVAVFIAGTTPNPNVSPMLRKIPNRNVQFYVQFVITVPSTFNLEVSTGLGDIETADIGGRVSLVTQGGNVTTGRVGMLGLPVARDRTTVKIETQGGHITLKDVAGDVDAYTAGGHIVAGTINGNAKLRTGGGHIRAARIKGSAHLETDGGNIAVGEASSFVTVRTAGGQIDLGEVHGSVHAENGGGGIRVISVAGPMEVATNGGSICLTRVANRVHAETGEGTITAWINPDESEKAQVVRLPGPSQLASHTGDIVVYLPRNIAMTIDATVENGGPGRIQADPNLPLTMQGAPNGPVHMMAYLNGGGAPLKLHTMAGKIQLQYLDTQAALRKSLQDEEKQRLAERLQDLQAKPVSLSSPVMAPGSAPPELSPNDAKDDWFDSAKKRFEVIFMGSIREEPKDFQNRLTASPKPEYPAFAKNAGVQGLVILQLRLKSDGSVTVEKVLEGQPALVDAASEAIRRWRGRPAQINGKNVEVVSTVSFEFQLR
jgi:TonB family protein